MYRRTVLDNGLVVLTAPMPHTYSVSITAFVGAGSRYESDRLAGTSHFLEHMVFKGTRLWPTAKSISDAIEGTGGIMNAGTEREMTVYWAKVAHPYLNRALSVIMDMLLAPLLDPSEMEKERKVILEELAMTNDYPTHRVALLIDETMWPNHPMGRDIGGTKESVSALTRQDLVDYMKSQYTPGNVVVSAAGNISHEDMVEEIARMVRDWRPASPLTWQPVLDGQVSPRLTLEQRKTEQAHMCIALPALPADHPDRHALDLLNVVLGEGMSSRLFMELRENRGLVYDVHSAVTHYRDTGALTVYYGLDPANAYEATGVILDQLAIARKGLTQEELDKAKELAKGRLLLRMEDTRATAMWFGAQELLLNRIYTVEEVLERVDLVTTEDVQRVAEEVLREERLNMAIVGPFRSDSKFRKLIGA